MMNPQFLLAGLWSAGLLALVILANTGLLARWLPWACHTPGIDKVGHVLLMAGLASALRRA
ncbi:hypothetical protein HQ590_09460 [bacterium]|nr:hypothetical protein [bacterium]